jgi:hypothetical protein
MAKTYITKKFSGPASEAWITERLEENARLGLELVSFSERPDGESPNNVHPKRLKTEMTFIFVRTVS